MKKEIYIAFAVLIVLGLVGAVSAFWPFTGWQVNPPASCEDSDGGQDLYVFGTVTYPGAWGGITEITDKCKNTQILKEAYCPAGQKKGKYIEKKCEADCIVEQGVCATPAKPACVDGDGSDTTEKDKVTVGTQPPVWDRCNSDNTKVIEQECNVSNDRVENTYDCTYRCDDGKCISNPSICSDTDNGITPAVGGIVKITTGAMSTKNPDVCLANNKKLREVSCDEDSKPLASEIYCQADCTTTAMTFEGRSYNVGNCTPKVDTCSETDNGKDFNVNGTTTYADSKGKVSVKKDACIGKSKKLREYYCENNLHKSEETTCPDVCQNGKCVVRDIKCTDTDNGKVWGTKGTVTSEYATVSDFCFNNKKIGEFYCPDSHSGKIGLIHKDCKYGCENGICVAGPTNEGDDGVDVPL